MKGMLPPPPPNEAERLAVLASYNVVGTAPEPAFDDLVKLAARLVGTPIALISLVDKHRQWFKARVGLEAQETPRELSFCTHALVQDEARPEMLVVPDAHQDPRFAENPLVLGDPKIRFYAGAPLVLPGNLVLGTLCVIDRVPRELTEDKAQLLTMLARQVIAQLELRRMLDEHQGLLWEMQQVREMEMQEMAERRAAEDALRRANERYQAVLQATQDVVWDWDWGRGQMNWSERLGTVFGHGQSQSGARPSWREEQIHPEDRDRVHASLVSTLERRQVSWTEEYRFRCGDGSYAHVLDRAVVRYDEAGRPTRLIGAMADMTEQRELSVRLSLADRMATVGRLAAGVGHEINNPLSYVLSNVRFSRETLEELPAGSFPDLSEVCEALKEAEEGSERVRRIVRDLKTLSSAEDEDVRAVNVREPIESAVTIAENELRHRAQLIRDYAELPPVQGNSGRLAQVLLNLVVNAIEALPDGAVERNEVRITTRAVGKEWVAIEVSDTGPGISSEVRARLFEPFFTTKAVGEGTGLGLSISHQIITRLGGKIEVESELGQGATFRVLLPVAKEALKAEPAPVPQQPSPVGVRLCIIDDDPLVGRGIQRMLGREFSITNFVSPRKAFEWLTEGGSCDLIFCDLMMPEMTGMELYRALIAKAPELRERILFMTGGAFTPGASEFLQELKEPYLEKPLDPATVLDFIRERLRRLGWALEEKLASAAP
jgi:PAS domain S-box-containing protein